MKKAELKRLLKPLVKECIKECLHEEGVLSSVISEVVKGMNGAVIQERATPVVSVAPSPPPRRNNVLREQKRKLLDAIGKDSYGGVDIFEGMAPLPPQLSPQDAASNPLGGVAPADPGVDISGIVALGGKKWKAFMG